MGISDNLEKLAKRFIPGFPFRNLQAELKETVKPFNSYREIEIEFDDEDIELAEVLMSVKLFTNVLSHFIAFDVKNSGLEYAGILTGLRLGELIAVTGAYPAKRIRASHSGFTIPEDELIRIDKKRIENNQPGFVGLCHLHPGFGVFLSSRDIEATERFCRFYGKAINLVISMNHGKLEYKFFTVKEGRPKELAYRFLVGRYHV